MRDAILYLANIESTDLGVTRVCSPVCKICLEPKQ